MGSRMPQNVFCFILLINMIGAINIEIFKFKSNATNVMFCLAIAHFQLLASVIMRVSHN